MYIDGLKIFLEIYVNAIVLSCLIKIKMIYTNTLMDRVMTLEINENLSESLLIQTIYKSNF